jgi:hypothetical protein
MSALNFLICLSNFYIKICKTSINKLRESYYLQFHNSTVNNYSEILFSY